MSHGDVDAPDNEIRAMRARKEVMADEDRAMVKRENL